MKELLIDKETFIKTLTTLKEETDKEAELRKTLNKLYGAPAGFSVDFYPTIQLESTLLSLLKKLTFDAGGWIDYYVYDCEFGQALNLCNSVEDKDGNKIPLNTMEDLYNLLVQNYNESGGKI